MPQPPTVPAITFGQADGDAPDLLDGNPDLQYALYQVTIWTASDLATEQLAVLVRARLKGIGGTNFQKADIVRDQAREIEADTRLLGWDFDVRLFYPA